MTKKAPMWPLAVVLAIELFVTGSRATKYMKLHGLGELMKAFGTMRGDDLRGLTLSMLVHRQTGLECKLRRTKVTGAGRRAQWLPVFVAWSCCFSGRNWQAALFDLLKIEAFGYERDYLQPLPSEDFEGTVKRPAEPEDVRAFTAAMLEDLRVPQFDTETSEWLESDEKLIHPKAVLFWKGHSGRNFIPTMAAEFEFPKDQRDLAGKWQGDGSDAYVRSLRVTLFGMQDKLMICLRDRSQEHDESEILEQLTEYLRGKGVHEADIGQQMLKLDHSQYFIGNAAYSTGVRSADEELGETQAEDMDTAAADEQNEAELAKWSKLRLATQATKANEEKHNPSTEKGYYLSTVQGPKKQGLIITLHKVAGCHRRPGLELRNAIFKKDVDESDFTYKRRTATLS